MNEGKNSNYPTIKVAGVFYVLLNPDLIFQLNFNYRTGQGDNIKLP